MSFHPAMQYGEGFTSQILDSREPLLLNRSKQYDEVGKARVGTPSRSYLGVPIVGVVDTNCDPTPIHFPVPGNDDAIRSIRLFTKMVADAVLESRAFVREGGEEETVSFGGDGSEAEGEASEATAV